MKTLQSGEILFQTPSQVSRKKTLKKTKKKGKYKLEQRIVLPRCIGPHPRCANTMLKNKYFCAHMQSVLVHALGAYMFGGKA